MPPPVPFVQDPYAFSVTAAFGVHEFMNFEQWDEIAKKARAVEEETGMPIPDVQASIAGAITGCRSLENDIYGIAVVQRILEKVNNEICERFVRRMMKIPRPVAAQMAENFASSLTPDQLVDMVDKCLQVIDPIISGAAPAS
eukprot:tig00020952_g16500.t1